MTAVQKAKLDLLAKSHAEGAAGLIRSWVDAQPLPGATPKQAPARAVRPPRALAPTSSIPEPVGAQLSLTPARFVELDP